MLLEAPKRASFLFSLGTNAFVGQIFPENEDFDFDILKFLFRVVESHF
jgi:hypothetical protein